MTSYEGVIPYETWLAWLYEWRNMIHANRYVGLTGIDIWDGKP
jgi:hypothetical protein